MYKKVISICLALVISLSAWSAVSAANDIKVVLNGSQMTFDVSPIIKNGRTLVPMRAIFEALGAEIGWDNDTRTVTGTKDGNVVILVIGSTSATGNGETITLDVPAEISNGRTLVPLRFIAESLDAKVEWDGETRTVTITTGDVNTGIPAEMLGSLDNLPIIGISDTDDEGDIDTTDISEYSGDLGDNTLFKDAAEYVEPEPVG